MTPRAAAGSVRNKNLSFLPGGPAVRSKHLGLLLSLSDTMWGGRNFKKSTQRQSDHLGPNWDFPGFSMEGPWDLLKMLLQTWVHWDNWSPYRERTLVYLSPKYTVPIFGLALLGGPPWTPQFYWHDPVSPAVCVMALWGAWDRNATQSCLNTHPKKVHV